MGQFTIIEHFSDLFKFKLESDTPSGTLFGSFENNKEKL
jgi:hypothetical protein